MTRKEAHEEKMKTYIKTAIEYLEMALNVAECDDNFNDNQNDNQLDKLNDIYDSTADAIKILVDI